MYTVGRCFFLIFLFFSLLVSSTVFASDVIIFEDPNAGELAVASFDWLPAGSLSDEAIPLSTDVNNPTSFQQLFQAKLGNFIDADTNPLSQAGVNDVYEITLVASFGETGLIEYSDPNISVAAFTLDVAASVNYVEIYIDYNKNADATAGTGYDDGELLMRGVISEVDSYFNARPNNVLDLDQSGSNSNYSGIGTVQGDGATRLVATIDPTTINKTYFPDAATILLQFDLNTSLILPFNQAIPPTQVLGVTPEFGGPSGVYTSVNGLASTNAQERVDFFFQTDANSSVVTNLINLPGSCRMTGGNVTYNNFLDYDGTERIFYSYVDDTYAEMTEKVTGKDKKTTPQGTKITTGGQVGAPSTPGTPKNGHWTHTQHAGAEGGFTFLAGTASAPPGTEISDINCADPGWCVQARCAPYKQIFWEGIGYFPYQHKGDAFDAVFPADGSCDVVPGGPQKDGTLHYFRAMVGDFGENDKPNRSSQCNWEGGPSGFDVSEVVLLNDPPVLDDQFGYKDGQVCEKCNDYYQIEIYCGSGLEGNPIGNVIYTFADYVDGGNYQIHPETGEHCTADLFQ